MTATFLSNVYNVCCIFFGLFKTFFDVFFNFYPNVYYIHICCVLHLSNEPGELWQWQHHVDDSTVNIVIHYYYCVFVNGLCTDAEEQHGGSGERISTKR